MAHIRRWPKVSATHLSAKSWRSPCMARPYMSDMQAGSNAGLRRVLLDIYTPRYGPDWEASLDANVYAQIDRAHRMFTFHME
jgi:hypothetical protein